MSATLINHTTVALDLEDATGGEKDDTDAPFLLAWGSRSKVPLKPGASMLIGNIASDYRIRFAERVQVGSTLPVTLLFHYHGLMTDGAPSTTAYAPVVSRTAKYAGVANNGPNNAITVHGAQIVLVPGQDRAYIGGWTTSTIEDIAYTLPTATTTKGFPVSYRHQTATGGGYAIAAFPGKKTSLGGPPYLDDGGDRDYFLASEIRVGQTIKVTIRFPSGDVIARFKVVQGKVDGTI